MVGLMGTVTFDKALDESIVVPPFLTMVTGTTEYKFLIGQFPTGNIITGSMQAIGPGPGSPECRYDNVAPNIVGTNGVPVESFVIPLSIS